MNAWIVMLLALVPQVPARGRTPSLAPAPSPQKPAAAMPNVAPQAPSPKPPSPQTAPAPDAAPAPGESEPAAPEVAAYRGTLAEGLAEIEAHANAKEVDRALEVADALLAPTDFLRWRARVRAEGGWKAKAFGAVDPVLDACGIEPLPPAHRAAVEYARGVALAGAGRAPEAERAFEAARAQAGPGPLRLDAVYDLGTLVLEEGEALRAKIPEIQARSGAAPATAAPGAPGAPAAGAQGTGDPADDPLAKARAAYLRAREALVERVQSDWRDEDTRANLELVQRRLHELDELEKQREEKKKEDEQKKQDEQKDQKPQDQKDGQDPKDKKDEKKPEDQQKPKDPSDSKGQEPPKPEDEKKPPEEPKPEEQEPKPQPPDDAKGEPLSKEQMMQLLDRLKELEEQARKLQEQMQRARRVKVKKDW